jgi:hypothetical protein
MRLLEHHILIVLGLAYLSIVDTYCKIANTIKMLKMSPIALLVVVTRFVGLAFIVVPSIVSVGTFVNGSVFNDDDGYNVTSTTATTVNGITPDSSNTTLVSANEDNMVCHSDFDCRSGRCQFQVNETSSQSSSSYCFCHSGYMGTYCQNKCTAKCLNGGQCRSVPLSNGNSDLSLSLNNGNGGYLIENETMLSEKHHIICVCPDGFFGHLCEQMIDNDSNDETMNATTKFTTMTGTIVFVFAAIGCFVVLRRKRKQESAVTSTSTTASSNHWWKRKDTNDDNCNIHLPMKWSTSRDSTADVTPQKIQLTTSSSSKNKGRHSSSSEKKKKNRKSSNTNDKTLSSSHKKKTKNSNTNSRMDTDFDIQPGDEFMEWSKVPAFQEFTEWSSLPEPTVAKAVKKNTNEIV